MNGEYYRLLVRRARWFLELSKELLERGLYDLAVFHAEQAVQLRLKALLYRVWNLTPRHHSIRELLGFLRNKMLSSGLTGLANRIDDFTRNYRSFISSLDEAYTMSRYGSIAYDEDVASKLVELSYKLWNLLDKVEEEILGGGTGAGETQEAR